jgi:hypothetical protein
MRKSKRSISIVTVLTAVMALIWSAGLAEAADPLLWPLQEGQWMEFLVQSPDQSPAWKAQIKVTGAKAVGDTQYFSVEVPIWGQGTQEGVFLRSSEKGLYRLETEGECPVAEVDQFGTTFRCRTGDEGWEVTTLLAEVALTVPVGTFTTAYLFRKHIEYHNGSMSPDWDVYIVPGLGPVKQVDYSGNFNEGQSAPGFARIIELVRVGMPLDVGADAMQRVPARPDAEAELSSTEAAGSRRMAATLGTVVEVRESSFILKQESLEVVPTRESVVPFVKHNLAIGYVGNHLEVLTDNATQITIGGKPASLFAVTPETRVLVAGVAEGKGLKADVVLDLSSYVPPPEEVRKTIIQTKGFGVPIPSGIVAAQEEPLPGALSTCMGQEMDYNDPSILEFQGCWLGPSASGRIETYNAIVFCASVDFFNCFAINGVDYTAALAGWGFAFPYRFSASGSNLTYHVGSPISLKIEPLDATQDDHTLWGGLGVSLVLDIKWAVSRMGPWVDFAEIPVPNQLSMVHEAASFAPLDGETLRIKEVSCPKVEITIPDTPINLLTINLCEDLTLNGAPFKARVKASGLRGYLEFGRSGNSLNPVRPDSLTVDVEFSEFNYVPELNIGFYLRFDFFDQSINQQYTTPTTPIASGSFMAITTPFPAPDSFMTIATAPDLSGYLPQPTSITITLPVAPAPTHLTMIPPDSTLREGEPVQACLQEDHLNVPVSGQTVHFTTGMPGGQPGITVDAATGTDGIARAVLPAGEHKALHAVWGGNSYYRASTSSVVSNVTITAAPDLKGEWIALDRKCSYRNKRPNCSMSGKLKIENIGSLKAPKSVVRFYLSDDKVYDQGDTLLKQMAVGNLGAGKSSTKTLNYTIPSGGTAGGKYIIAVIDADNAVVEYKGDNHVVFGPFEVIVF